MSAAKQESGQRLWALFTDTPQLKSWEAAAARRDARKVERDLHRQAHLELLAAYHDSNAKHYAAVNRRLSCGVEDESARRLSAEHAIAATKMVELFDRYVRLPVSGKVERADRGKLMRKVAGGINGASNALLMWRTLEPQWLVALAGGDE